MSNRKLKELLINLPVTSTDITTPNATNNKTEVDANVENTTIFILIITRGKNNIPKSN